MIIISMYYLTFCDVLIITKISDNPNTFCSDIPPVSTAKNSLLTKSNAFR